MSKIGNKPIPVSANVQITIENNKVTVKGKEGELFFSLPRGLLIMKEKDNLLIKTDSNNGKIKALQGLYRSLIYNAVVGVDKPWQKRLEIVGTGYNVKLQAEDLVFKLSFSHPVIFKKVDRIKYAIEGNNKIIVTGVDKQLVGQVAYQIKIIKKPDAYKGKGIKYEGEKLKIKPGKKVKAAGAPA